MASAAGTRGTALLFSFSAVVFIFLLRQAPAAPGHAVADLLASALDRLLDGRGMVELATRRNMILLCHAILFLILRDAGLLGAPARRRSCCSSPPGEVTVVAAAVTEIACSAAPVDRLHATRSAVVAQAACAAVPVPVPARPHATRSTVVWRRRPRNRAVVAPVHVHDHDAAGRVVECRSAAEAAATWAAPVQTTNPPPQAVEEASAAVATKQIVVAESPRNDDDGLLYHDRAREAVVEPLEHPTSIVADDGERDDCDDDRRTVAVATADDKRIHDMEGTEMELADDRTFEEFIRSQRRQMRQESLKLVRSAYAYQAMATCY